MIWVVKHELATIDKEQMLYEDGIPMIIVSYCVDFPHASLCSMGWHDALYCRNIREQSLRLDHDR